METIVTVYQATTTLMTVYGYWKIAHTGYYNYHRAKLLFEVTVSALSKVNNLLSILMKDRTPEEIKNLNLPIEEIENIKNELDDYKEFKSNIFYSKKPFKTHWEILHLKDIQEEINNEPNSYIPKIFTFYN